MQRRKAIKIKPNASIAYMLIFATLSIGLNY